MTVRNREFQRVPAPKMEGKRDLNPGWLGRKVCSTAHAGKHLELLASEHLRQNCAAE
jgi:hypothetical protein